MLRAIKMQIAGILGWLSKTYTLIKKTQHRIPTKIFILLIALSASIIYILAEVLSLTQRFQSPDRALGWIALLTGKNKILYK